MKEYIVQAHEKETIDVFEALNTPEIIRCKDCKHCEYPNAGREWCKKGHLHGSAETWFCADGERRDNDD